MQFLLKYDKHFCLIIFLSAILLYVNTVWNEYNMDDELVTINHRNTSRGLSAFQDILNQYYHEDEMGYKYEYRPITHLSFALEHEFLGESAHFSHAINVLLYALSCLLLFLFLKRLLPQKLKLLAWVATLLFVFHPIHTEVVASIKNRDEILAMIFGMMSGLLLLRALKQKKYWLSIPAAGLFSLALLSKVTFFPFLMIFPIGLMFFYEVKFKELFFITLPLAIAGFLSVKLIFDNDKTFLIYTAVGAVLLVYSILNLKIIYSFLKETILKATRAIVDLSKGTIKSMEEESLDFDVLLKFKFYTVGVHYFFSIIVLIVFFLNFYLELANYYYIVIFHAFLFLMSPTKKALFFTTIITWISIIYFFILEKDMQGDWVGLFIGLNMFSLQRLDNKKFTLMSFLFTGSLLVLSIFFNSNEELFISIAMNVVLSLVLLFNVLKNIKAKKIIFTIIIIIIAINLIEGSIFQIILVGGIVSSLFYSKWKFPKILFISYVIIITIFILKNLLYITGLASPIRSEIDIQIEIRLKIENTESTQKENIDINEALVNFNRPLNFVESPVHAHSPTEEKIATGALIFGKYLKKVLLPYPMGFYYGYAYISPQTFDNFKVYFLSLFFVLFLILLVYTFFKKWYVFTFGLLIFVSTISQLLGVFYPIPGVMGDRFLFLPSIGFVLLLGGGICKLLETKFKKIGFGILLLLLFVYGFLTIQRNFEWKDRITLFEADIEYLSESAQAQALLGYAYMQKATENSSFSDIAHNELALKAKNQFEKAIQIYPDFVNWWYDKSRIEGELGLIDEALNSLKKSISLDEGFLPDPYFNIANIYFYKAEYQEAIYYFNETIKWGYKEPVVYNSMGASYIELGNINAAESILLEGFNLHPNNFDINVNLGLTYMDLSNSNLALRYLENAQRLNPNSQDLNAMIQDIKREISN